MKIVIGIVLLFLSFIAFYVCEEKQHLEAIKAFTKYEDARVVWREPSKSLVYWNNDHCMSVILNTNNILSYGNSSFCSDFKLTKD